jgi:CHAT domain-containing protein
VYRPGVDDGLNMADELTIEVNSKTGNVEAKTDRGAEAIGQLSLDQLRRDTIRVFEDWLRKDKIRVRQELVVLGHHLYFALFSQGTPGKTSPADLLRKCLEGVQKDEGSRLRLQLRFTEDNASLIRLPWEFLYSPDRQQFLATDVNLVLSRYIPLGVDREPLNPEKGSLRILIMISRPSDQQDVIAKDVVKAIENVPGVKVEIVKNSTLDALEAALTEHRPHVFHFIGHGNYDTESGGSLALVNPKTGESDPLDDVTLIQSFQAKGVFPRLVFLHMCDGGKSEGDSSALQAFSGFAPRLMHARIPAVVAMQYPIKNKDAKEFAVAFYQDLATGGTIDGAVQQGRHSIDRLRQTRVFGTPVLYMHSCDGIILPPPSPSSSSSESPVSSAPASSPVPGKPDKLEVGPLEAAAPQTLALGQAPIDALMQIGGARIRTLSDQVLRGRLQVQLPGLRTQLIGKNVNDVVNLLFDRWEGADPEAKIVWQAMLDHAEANLR